MKSDVDSLIQKIRPESTVLLFGAGSSIPSLAPTVQKLQAHFEVKFGVSGSKYNLAEQTAIILNASKDRRSLIEELRSQFKGLKATGAILNLPHYKWKSIFTTNYDDIIEQCYLRQKTPLSVYSTNFDFGKTRDPNSVQFFKIHGTIERDVVDGDASRIILTDNDYEQTEEFREKLYDRLKSDLDDSNLIIIGHSLADPDIKSLVNRASILNQKANSGGRINLLMYGQDEGLASLYESRGISVYFGGIDDFFSALVKKSFGQISASIISDDPLDQYTSLRPSTVDAIHSSNAKNANVSGMYNGWPATYSDIAAGFTFPRNIADEIETFFMSSDKFVAVLLGASGVGKTTAARQVIASLIRKGFLCWEHKADQELQSSVWREVAQKLESRKTPAALLIDDAHFDLAEINSLIENLSNDNSTHLRVILTSTKHQWHPRSKSPAFFKVSADFYLSNVHENEIDELITLVENKSELRALVDENFSGFSRNERRRRLIQRCESDMFVCLKNIFSSDAFDHILLREFAGLDKSSQDIYRAVAAMESAGVRVHRQLVIRLLGIPGSYVSRALLNLSDIIIEQTVNEREGIYSWRGRHKVIMDIIAHHKYYDKEKHFDLFSKVIDCISPTYDIEIRTLRELCNIETGIASIPEKEKQNDLLRKMMSIAPSERVPRHRLIKNLIDLEYFSQADAEIKLFQKDFGLDGPTMRYRINLATANAVHSPGLLDEDRITLLEQAASLAASAVNRYKNTKAIIYAYCDVGIELLKKTGRPEVFCTAIQALKDAETRIGDSDISRKIALFERQAGLIDKGNIPLIEESVFED